MINQDEQVKKTGNDIPGIPVSQPEMNWPAIARTSEGVKGMSKDCGTALAVLRMLRTVW